MGYTLLLRGASTGIGTFSCFSSILKTRFVLPLLSVIQDSYQNGNLRANNFEFLGKPVTQVVAEEFECLYLVVVCKRANEVSSRLVVQQEQLSVRLLSSIMSFLECLKHGLPLNPLPGQYERNQSIAHAPKRLAKLSDEDRELAVKNALRYIPLSLHSQLETEFKSELDQYGHIYMYRFVPRFEIKAYPIEQYPAKCREAACIIMMIMNNLDKQVAQFPEELVTYGGNGQVFSNW